MSYDLHLIHPVSKEVLQLEEPHQMKGGTYAIGGTKDCSLNITYNYSKHWNKAFEGKHLRDLDAISGADSIPILEKAISLLGDDVDPDYWKATEGNAKTALIQLLALAKFRPDGIWCVH